MPISLRLYAMLTKKMKLAILAAASVCLLLLANHSRKEPAITPYYQSQFHTIEKLLIEDAFKPREVRSLSFTSADPKQVGVVTDRGYDLTMEARRDQQSQIRISSEDHPDEYVGTTYGGSGTLFHPENGVIRLKIANHSDIALRIAVTIEKSK